ncbi:hypothetical protein ACFE04_013997 [Oxalis oulophora]
MVKRELFSLLIVVIFAGSSIADYSTPSDFITTSCKATRYPSLCVECLSSYASLIKRSDHHLAHTALKVSLTSSKSASTFVSKMVKSKGIKPREYRAVKDCVETIDNTVDRLNESVKELGQMDGVVGKEEFLWHMSNVQTWVSAALTNANTCLDGFADRSMNGNVKTVIGKRVTHVTQVTSNGLALVNRFASRHKVANKS